MNKEAFKAQQLQPEMRFSQENIENLEPTL